MTTPEPGSPIVLTTEEPQRDRTNTWELYWFHRTDPDASYRADAETLRKAGFVPNVELDAARLDAGRMHYLGSMVRSRTSDEQAELNALMRKYPPIVAPPEAAKAAEGEVERKHPSFGYTAGEAEIVSHCVKLLEALSHVSLWSDTPTQLLRHQTLRKAESALAALIGFRRNMYNDGMHPELFSRRTTEPQPPAGSVIREPYQRGVNSRIDSSGSADSGTQSELGAAPVTNDVAPVVENTGRLPAGGGEERVMHQEARKWVAACRVSTSAHYKHLFRYIEQSEREAAVLRERFQLVEQEAAALNRRVLAESESRLRTAAAHSKLTDALRAEVAELKAERDGLRAELSKIRWLVCAWATGHPTKRAGFEADLRRLGCQIRDEGDSSGPPPPESHTSAKVEPPATHSLNEFTYCTRCKQFDPPNPCPGKPQSPPQGGHGPTEALRRELVETLRKVCEAAYHRAEAPEPSTLLSMLADELESKAGKL